jgi:hypothetical protein
VMKPKKPYSPTRRCPHRWCRKVHSMTSLAVLVLTGPMLFHAGWLYLLFFALVMAVLTQVIKIAWKGKSMMDVAMEDAVAAGAGSDGNMSSRHLIVRPVWANIAIGMDLLGLMNAASAAWIDVHGHADYSAPTSSAEALTVLGIVAALVWFWEFAHRKATEPATPVRLPSFVKSPETQS